MSDYVYCKTCGEYGWKGSHVCPPVHFVWDPNFDGEEENAQVFHARNLESAVEKYAKKRSWDDSELFEEGLVFAKGPGDKEPRRFRVEGEMVPEFRIEEESL